MKMQSNRNNRASFRAAAFIENCPPESYSQLTVNWLANKIGVNPTYLSRAFKEDFNCHLKDYIEQAKMDKAEELLNSGMAVKDVSRFLDYTNPSYFGRKFRKHKGGTPRSRRGKTR
jgi:YesN/AraC family two-component response regulator